MMKLNIQMFASTNKTTNYELPQFVGTDKPTWLGDFNTAMSTIDSGMATNKTNIESMNTRLTSAEATASQASQDVTALSGSVNTLSNNLNSVTTTANNAQQTATSALNIANTANGKADTNATNITNLTTRVTNAEANIEDFNLSTFENIPQSAVTLTNGGTIGSVNLNVAKNSNGSLAKIYGNISLSSVGSPGTVSFQTSLRPEENITINGGCIRTVRSGSTVHAVDDVSMTLNTNGVVSVQKTWATQTSNENKFIFINSLLYIKQFGDIVIPEE